MIEPLDLATVELRGNPLVLATSSQVDDLEARLGVRFPDGYREYVTQLGEGSLNTFVRVLPPWRILSELDEHRGMMAGFWFWESGKVAFGQEEAMDSIPIADTLDGDVIVFHPSDPRQLIVLPRNRERLYARGPDLLEAINWVCSGGVLRRFGPSRYFEPFDSRLETREPSDALSATVASEPRSDLTRSPRDVLMAYFAELREVEEYAAAVAGGPKAFNRPDFDIPDDLVERSEAVHARYCTPRLAKALSGGSVTVSWPPAHHSDAIRVLEEKQTRPGRVVIRTSEGKEWAVLHQYVLEQSDGEWRISSEKDLGLDESVAPPRGGFSAKLRELFPRDG